MKLEYDAIQTFQKDAAAAIADTLVKLTAS